MGYGCLSSKAEDSTFSMFPAPYRVYELRDDNLPANLSYALKLPSWVCKKNLTVVGTEILEPLWYSEYNEEAILVTNTDQ